MSAHPRRPRSGKDLRLGRRRARHQRSMSRPQQTVGIIGANGAGKTTFVNMITGHLTADQGHDPVRGPRHHRHAVARDHAARHLALVPGGAGFSVADRARQHVRRGRHRARAAAACWRRSLTPLRSPGRDGGGRSGARTVPASAATATRPRPRCRRACASCSTSRMAVVGCAAAPAARRADQRHLDRGEIRPDGRRDVGAEEPQDHRAVRRARHGDRGTLRRPRARLLRRHRHRRRHAGRDARPIRACRS